MSAHLERLAPPPSWWFGAFVFAATWGWLLFVVAGPWPAVGTTLAVGVVVGGLLWRYTGAVVVAVDDDALRVGGARLPLAQVGGVEPLDAAAMREWHGPRADARAWLVHRVYLAEGVRIVLDDPHDPTPYWLVSSRRPQELTAALRSRATPDPEQAEQGGTDGQA